MIFDPHALESVVARTLAESPDVPEGARGAFVLVGNQDAVRAVVAVKVADQWTVKAFVEVEQKDLKHPTYGVSVTGTW